MSLFQEKPLGLFYQRYSRNIMPHHWSWGLFSDFNNCCLFISDFILHCWLFVFMSLAHHSGLLGLHGSPPARSSTPTTFYCLLLLDLFVFHHRLLAIKSFLHNIAIFRIFNLFLNYRIIFNKKNDMVSFVKTFAIVAFFYHRLYNE